MTACPSAALQPFTACATRWWHRRGRGLGVVQAGVKLTSLVLTSLVALAGCGGADMSTPAPAAALASAPSAAPSPVRRSILSATVLRLSGVAAHGAPLTSARVRVVDATGALVGSTTTHPSDGSYALTLLSSAAPLIVQVAGTDARGQPVVLHTAVPALAGVVVAHATPLSDAAIALAIGADPLEVFALAPTAPTVLAPLASTAAAADFIKTLVKSNLSDTKTVDAKKLDLFGDEAFAADKTGLDLALESLVVSYGLAANGRPQLQLANKLSSTVVEVAVDLAMAAAELAKGSSGKPANAITSTLKATTSPGSALVTLGLLDELPAAFNKLLAENAGREPAAVTTALASSGLLARYTRHDGRTASELAARLGELAGQRMQFGRLQVLGCVDENTSYTSCTKLVVAARVTDSTGRLVGQWTDVVSYITSPTARWLPVGNGQPAGVAVRAAAWLDLQANGLPATDMVANPRLGVQLLVGDGVPSATLQTPGGYTLPLARCEPPLLCTVTANSRLRAPQDGDDPATATVVLRSGQLWDNTVFADHSAWLGRADQARGARYRANLVDATTAATSRFVRLRGVFDQPPASSRFPVLDFVGVTRPLPDRAPPGKVRISWKGWAAANLDLRLLALRAVFTNGDGTAVVADWPVDDSSIPELEIEVPALPEGSIDGGLWLWLTAQDTQGRAYHTRYRMATSPLVRGMP